MPSCKKGKEDELSCPDEIYRCNIIDEAGNTKCVDRKGSTLLENLYFFINSKYCVPITIMLFYFYYKISKIEKKKKDQLLLTWLSFSLLSLLGESIIISNNTGISLQYNNSDIYNVSSWLFSAYASMVFINIINE